MAYEIWAYTIGSLLVVSLISFVGIFFLSLNKKLLERLMLFLVSFAVGALIGDAFIHLLPEAIEEGTDPLFFGVVALIGMGACFVIEKIIRWQHRHIFEHKEHKRHHEKHKLTKPFVWINLFGDGIHNFVDGMLIAGSYLVSIPLGLTTTFAIIFHESAQEIGDFAVLIQGGLSRVKALWLNFASALTAVLGGIVTLIIGQQMENITQFLIPFTFAGFIYIALSNLIPEMHHEDKLIQLTAQLVGITVGILVMASLLLLE